MATFTKINSQNVITSVHAFNASKTYQITAINADLFKIKLFVAGQFHGQTMARAYNTSEFCFVSQIDLKRLYTLGQTNVLKTIKSSLKLSFTSLKKWFNKPSKKQLIESEIARKMQTTNFKFIGGLSVLKQLEVIKLRANGLTQNAIAEKLSTSRGTVIRTLKQKSKVLYIADCFNRLHNV